MKVLVIEDQKQLLETISEFLISEKYLVETASTFESALYKIADFEYDCILLDIMLPDGNGLNLLKELTVLKKNKAVIIISAKDSVDDKVEGLALGADDYLAKPFHLAELNARIKSIIRRNNHQVDNSLVWNNLELSTDERALKVNGNEISLNRKEFDLLYLFMSNPKKLLTKTIIAEFVWGDHAEEADNLDFVYSQIKNLRKKLVKENAQADIQAVYGVGYKWV